MPRLHLPLLSLALVAGALVASAPAQTLTGIMYRTGGQTDGSNPRLYDVDSMTGALSNERKVNVNLAVGIAAASDGRLYGLTTRRDREVRTFSSR